MRLSEKYGDRPPAELPLLFQRITQNAIRDHFRRTKVRFEDSAIVCEAHDFQRPESPHTERRAIRS